MKIKDMFFITVIIVLSMVTGARGQEGDRLEKYNVVWESPSNIAKDSMPIGNGEVGINVWVEEDGDLLFYISRTDSWGDNGRLLKLGRVRVKLTPNPFAKGLAFRQELRLRQGDIIIRGGERDSGARLRVWVDAHNPVINVGAMSRKDFQMEVSFETWRETGYKLESTQISDLYNVLPESDGDMPHPYDTIMYPDVIVPGEKDKIVWYHYNVKSGWPVTMKHQGLGPAMEGREDPLLARTFGGLIKGRGLVTVSDRVIKSAKPAKRQGVSIYTLTKPATTVAEWMNEIDQIAERVEKLDYRERVKVHRKWWDEFWNRSWIRISGSEDGQICSKGYTLQRYMHACAGRGNYPIKFNGSIFTTPARGDPDWRQWGPGYWWQNQRLVYWSMIGAGDFDLIQTFFKMYEDILPVCKQRTQIYFGHEGAHYPECLFFWGSTYNDDYGWNREGKHVSYSADPYVRYEWQGGLELLAMMIDYYDYTEDEVFLKGTLLPMADEIIKFYDLHYKRDDDGKLHIWPAQALETWWECTNPMPEVAGLKFVLGKLLDLPKKHTKNSQRKFWNRLRGELPAIPMRKLENGEKTLAPAEKFAHKGNIENPELYAIFPYRLYGVDKPELEMAKLAFEHRWHIEGNKGHDQDEIHAAFIGLDQLAGKMLTRRFGTEYLTARFPTYWYGYDWIPDHCHSGSGMIALQAMLMQCEDEKILLFPAWPKEWDVEFKLHAPYSTTVEGVYIDGKLKEVKVSPKSRAKDIVIK